MLAQRRATTAAAAAPALTREPPSLQPTATNRNNERQARHLRGDQLRQVQAEEDGDAGEESPAYKRSHRPGEGGGGDVVKRPPPHLPPSRHALYTLPPPLPPSSRIALFSVTSFSCITL